MLDGSTKYMNAYHNISMFPTDKYIDHGRGIY